jgi:hypothetical protein
LNILTPSTKVMTRGEPKRIFTIIILARPRTNVEMRASAIRVLFLHRISSHQNSMFFLQSVSENPKLFLSISSAVQGSCDRPTHSGGMQRPRHQGLSR